MHTTGPEERPEERSPNHENTGARFEQMIQGMYDGSLEDVAEDRDDEEDRHG